MPGVVEPFPKYEMSLNCVVDLRGLISLECDLNCREAGGVLEYSFDKQGLGLGGQLPSAESLRVPLLLVVKDSFCDFFDLAELIKSLLSANEF